MDEYILTKDEDRVFQYWISRNHPEIDHRSREWYWCREAFASGVRCENYTPSVNRDQLLKEEELNASKHKAEKLA